MQINFLPVEDEVLNNMLVDINTFSSIACMGGRAFGVITNCDPCDLNVDLCLRKHLIDNLIKAQSLIERRVGYSLTPRYHVQEIPWDRDWATDRGAIIRFQAEWPGIEVVNVRLQYTPLTELGEIPINYAVLENIPLSPGGDGKTCIAELNASVVDNPAHVTIQDSNGKTYPIVPRLGFPRINVNGNWEVPIGRSDDPLTCPEDLYAYHCHLAYVDITPPTCSGEVVPVYTGTEQRIPLAKPVETVAGGKSRYWFNVWELVRPAFQNETVNISSGEYYKLFQTISFSCVEEVAAPPVVICKTGKDCSETVEVTDGDLSIRVGRDSILELCLPSGACATPCGSRPDRLRIYYKTNPEVLGYEVALVEAIEAITYWAAASLPMESCDCKIDKGFIKTAQERYVGNMIHPFNQAIIQNFKYGDLHGLMVFADRLSHLPKYQMLVLA